MRHYHRRSNVETTFAMIKRKLGERIRAKNDRGMLNELLCCCICHNVSVLIQEMHELGIDVDFEEAKRIYKEKKYKEPKQMLIGDWS